MRGHNDTVTGLSLSPDGSYVLSNAMDNTVRIWDVRPFAPQERCVKIFQGHQHNFENVGIGVGEMIGDSSQVVLLVIKMDK